MAGTLPQTSMIHLTRINQQQLVLNSDLIEHIEATPDTIITMTSGQKLVVADSPDQVIEKVVAFRRSIHQIPRMIEPEAEN